jgi:hypothetical protein
MADPSFGSILEEADPATILLAPTYAGCSLMAVPRSMSLRVNRRVLREANHNCDLRSRSKAYQWTRGINGPAGCAEPERPIALFDTVAKTRISHSWYRSGAVK